MKCRFFIDSYRVRDLRKRLQILYRQGSISYYLFFLAIRMRNLFEYAIFVKYFLMDNIEYNKESNEYIS